MGWMPCSGLKAYDGLVWLPRLIEKARRFEEGRRSGRDLMEGYFYGSSDAIDGPLLQFLRVDDETVLGLVAEQADDREVARGLIERSGRSLEERQSFSAQLRRKFFDFSLLEADEGSMPPGPKRSALAFLYRRILMPIFAAQYRSAKRRSSVA